MKMPNPFYNYMPKPTNPFANIMQAAQMVKANPMQFFLQRNLNIPNEIVNDPNAIMNYLLSTGQISQMQVNNAYRLMKNQNGGA